MECVKLEIWTILQWSIGPALGYDITFWKLLIVIILDDTDQTPHAKNWTISIICSVSFKYVVFVCMLCVCKLEIGDIDMDVLMYVGCVLLLLIADDGSNITNTKIANKYIRIIVLLSVTELPRVVP